MALTTVLRIMARIAGSQQTSVIVHHLIRESTAALIRHIRHHSRAGHSSAF